MGGQYMHWRVDNHRLRQLKCVVKYIGMGSKHDQHSLESNGTPIYDIALCMHVSSLDLLVDGGRVA